MGTSGVEQVERRLWRHRVVFAAIATVVLMLLVLAPFAVGDAISDVLGPPEGRIYALATVVATAPPGTARLHAAIVALSELQQTATLRVTGHYVCEAGCAWSDRVLFVALREDEAAGMPPTASVTLTPGEPYVNQNIELPMRGHASRYPFDRYDLLLGVVVQRVYPDGTVETLAASRDAGLVSLTLQEEVARMVMPEPAPVGPERVRGDGQRYQYFTVADVAIQRPLYLRILSLLLVLLVAAASAYAVFMRPLHDLVLNAGALVVGIWGVRAMLVPMPWTWLTAIDLSLSVVIIFLLGAITVRAFVFAYERSGFRRPHGQSDA